MAYKAGRSCLTSKTTYVPDDQVFFERTIYVYFHHFADCANSYFGRCTAYLGPQSQLGLWAKRWLGAGGFGSDCSAADGPNLAPGASTVQLLLVLVASALQAFGNC